MCKRKKQKDRLSAVYTCESAIRLCPNLDAKDYRRWGLITEADQIGMSKGVGEQTLENLGHSRPVTLTDFSLHLIVCPDGPGADDSGVTPSVEGAY